MTSSISILGYSACRRASTSGSLAAAALFALFVLDRPSAGPAAPAPRGVAAPARADLAEAVFLSDRIYMMKTKPARIFNEVSIDIARPRKPEDSRILELEKTLVREFFSVLDTAT